MNRTNVTIDVDWLADRSLPTFQRPDHLRVYDMRGSSRAVQFSVATLVGLINRPQPQIYLISRRNDAFWLKEALAALPQELSPLSGDDILVDLLRVYLHVLQGMIIYDPALADSINIATMLAGQQEGMVVTPTQAATLQQSPYALPILNDLRKYHWRSRLEAYYWAKQHLLNQATPHLVAGFTPDIPLGIRSFLVATRTFIYWLDSRNIVPNPRVGWLSERCLMRQILRAFVPHVAHLGWFINEGTGVTMTSQAAKPVLASDFFSNLEIWMSLQASRGDREEEQPSYTIQPPVTPEDSGDTAPGEPDLRPGKAYISFTYSEGDNLQYIQEHMLSLWQDPARGTLPIGWAISPLLGEAAPAMAAYYTRTATPHDEFIAGPSGAGYIFPSWWPKAQLPTYLQYTGQLMQSMHLSLVQILDSNILQNPILALRALLTGSGMALINNPLQQSFSQTLAKFGIQGLLSGSGQRQASWKNIDGVLVYQNIGIVASVKEAVSAIRQATAHQPPRPCFLNVYVLAWTMTPTALKQVAQELGDEYEIVTPGTLIRVLKQFLRRDLIY